MQFTVLPSGQSLDIPIQHVVIAGWAGRDAHAVQHHIDELAALGVKPPRATPLFYRVGRELLTTAPAIDLAGDGSTGEAEAVLIATGEALYVTVGSDHTDRAAEAAGVTWSKQMCAKPVASAVWRFDEVVGHWDALQLTSRVQQNGVWRDYQTGTLASLRRPEDLLARYGDLAEGTAMFCGTLGAIPPIAWADAFEATLHDPVLGRSLVCRYAMTALPIAD